MGHGTLGNLGSSLGWPVRRRKGHREEALWPPDCPPRHRGPPCLLPAHYRPLPPPPPLRPSSGVQTTLPSHPPSLHGCPHGTAASPLTPSGGFPAHSTRSRPHSGTTTHLAKPRPKHPHGRASSQLHTLDLAALFEVGAPPLSSLPLRCSLSMRTGRGDPVPRRPSLPPARSLPRSTPVGRVLPGLSANDRGARPRGRAMKPPHSQLHFQTPVSLYLRRGDSPGPPAPAGPADSKRGLRTWRRCPPPGRSPCSRQAALGRSWRATHTTQGLGAPLGLCVQRGVWIHSPRREEMPECVRSSTARTSTQRPEAGPRALGGHAGPKEPHDHTRLSGAASRGAQGGARTRQPGQSLAGCSGAERCRDGVTTRPLRGRAGWHPGRGASVPGPQRKCLHLQPKAKDKPGQHEGPRPRAWGRNGQLRVQRKTNSL